MQLSFQFKSSGSRPHIAVHKSRQVDFCAMHKCWVRFGDIQLLIVDKAESQLKQGNILWACVQSALSLDVFAARRVRGGGRERVFMGEQRAEANRINAQRSSGPRTELGKSRSKMNALKHGLSAKKIVIGDEDPKEFEALRAALERDWQPEMAFESELVEQLAGLFCMRRVPAIEAAIVKAREEKAYSDVYSDVKRNRIYKEARERCS